MNSGPESCTGIGVVAWLFVIWHIRTWLREKHERRWSESPNMAIIQLVKETPKLATTYVEGGADFGDHAFLEFDKQGNGYVIFSDSDPVGYGAKVYDARLAYIAFS